MKEAAAEKLLLKILILGIFFNFSCDAPRLNPLDPENPNKQSLQIEGYVYSFSLPRIALQNALVLYSPENKAALSNLNGYFKIDASKKTDGWLIVKLDGYKTDSIYVVWNSNKFYKEFYLNQIPKLDSIEFYSVLTNHYPNIKNVSLTIRTKIFDRDNDIDSVFIQNKSMNVKLPLFYNPQSKFYERDFFEYDFNLEDLSELIGIKFDFIAKDINGFEYHIGSEKLNRIIKDEIILEYPVNYDSTSARPTLIWRRFVPGFKFNYSAEIYNNEFPPVVIWSKKNISMDSTSVIVDAELPAGNYFWVLWCIDQFLNRARSRPASFRVK